MKITKTSPLTGRVHSMDLPITAEQLQRWESGELVQQVFEDLSDVEREFLISGITEEEWNQFIVDDEDCEDCDQDISFTDEDGEYISNIKSDSNTHMLSGLYQIRFYDIDPDTGDRSNDRFLAYTDSQDKAELLMHVIAKDYMDQTSDPNRDFYIKNPS